MLNPEDDIYWRVVNTVTRRLRMHPINEIIRLPSVVITLPIPLWVVKSAWATRDPEVISHSVYNKVGARPPVVRALPGDDNTPTRGIFMTLYNVVRYNQLRWPMKSLPLVYRCSVCDQRTRHVHVAFVLRYYVSSPRAMCQALGIVPMDVSRIKLSMERTLKYISAQEVECIDFVVNNRRGLAYEDFRRSVSLEHTLLVEYASLGNPALFDVRTQRLIDRTQVVREVDSSETDHVAECDKYYSSTIGRVGADYKGEYVVFVVPRRDGKVDAPVTAGAVCKLSEDFLD
jgi:hypothetical protein